MVDAASNEGELKHLSTSIRNETPPFHLDEEWNTLHLIEVACRARRMLSNGTKSSTRRAEKGERRSWQIDSLQRGDTGVMKGVMEGVMKGV